MSHYKPYPAYKDSGVEWIGLVPEHWKVAQIKRISALNPKKSTLSKEKDSLCTFLPMEKLRTNAITLDETRPIHEVYDGYSYFCDDDILIAKVTPCFENGNIAVANGLVNGIGFGSTEINVLRVNGKGHNRFLYYRLQEEQFRTIAKSEMRGTGGLKRVPTELFESFTFGLPDTDEQVTIAATLDRETARIDALVEKKTRFIELLKEKRQALITHAVTKGLDPNVKMKDSGIEWIGQVPEHWKIAQIKRISALNPRKSTLSEEKDSLCTFLPMEKLRTNAVTLDETRPIHEVYGGYSYFSDGDILIAKVTPCFENGNIAVANGLVNGIGFGSTEINVLRVNGKGHNRFLYYRLQEEQFRTIAKSEMRGTGGLKRVPTELFESFTFGLPDTDEQVTIAATLDRETARIDALVEKKTRFIELLKEKRQALITHAVTKGLDRNAKMKDSGIEWIGQVPEEWLNRKVFHAFQAIGSGTTPPAKEHEWYQGGTIPWITTSELRENTVVKTKKCVTSDAMQKFSALKIFPAGSLAIAMYGATIGRLGFLGIPATTNQACCVLSGERDLNIQFLYYWLMAFRADIVAFFSEGGGQPNINQEVIASLRVPSPAPDEQATIVATLDRETARIDALISKAEQSITLLKERRAAFITAAVTGQIDLRGKQ